MYTCYGFFSTAWKESAARIVKEENKSKYYNSVYKDMSRFLKAVTIGLIAIMPFAFPILIDKGYNDAYVYIPILAIAIYYTCVSNFFGGIFAAYKDTKVMGYTTVASAIINIIINFALLNKLKIYAATFSTLIANVVVYIYRLIKLKKHIKLKQKIDFIYWILMIITLISYYYNNIITNIIMFIIVLGYCVITNKKMIGVFISKIKGMSIKEVKS